METRIVGVRGGVAFGLCTALALFLMQCGSGSGTSTSTTSTVTPAVDSSDTATTTIGNVASDSLGALAGGAGASLSKDDVRPENEGNQPAANEGAHGYACAAYNQQNKSQTCSCPGGGTVTHRYDNNITISGTQVTFNTTFQEVYAACVVPGCQGNKKMDGVLSGSGSGSFDQTAGGSNLRFSISTAKECGGPDAADGIIISDEDGSNAVQFGGNVVVTFNGQEESFSGSICTNPPGLPNGEFTFSSADELRQKLGDADSCQRSATAAH